MQISLYAITRIEKYSSKTAIARIEKHNERLKDVYKSNPDIDVLRSRFNIPLISPGGKYLDRINARIRDAGVKRVRKDSILMQDAIVTASPEFFGEMSMEQIRGFFEYALSFYTERFGIENFLSAVVHMDEKTPHMHFSFVPVTKDGRLSSKELIGGPAGLRKLQDEFFGHMKLRYPNLERGFPKKETRREHLPTELYKKAADITRGAGNIYDCLNGMSILDMNDRKKYLLKAFSELMPKIAEFEEELDSNKNFIEEMKSENTRLQRDTGRYSSLVSSLNNEIRILEEDCGDLQEEVDSLKAFLDKIPEDVKERIIRKEQEEKEHEKEIGGMSR